MKAQNSKGVWFRVVKGEMKPHHAGLEVTDTNRRHFANGDHVYAVHKRCENYKAGRQVFTWRVVAAPKAQSSQDFWMTREEAIKVFKRRTAA
jgi:hypothetical protein